MGFDFTRRASGLLGQRLYFACNNGEPLASLACAGTLDCRVQGQKIGLFRYIPDDVDDLANFRRRISEDADLLRTVVRCLDSLA